MTSAVLSRRILAGATDRRGPGQLLGHSRCPECGFPDAEIRNDKNGHPYRYCSDCTAQYFTRGDALKVRNLVQQIRR